MGEVNILYEVIGYTGMAFIVISFLFKRIGILRSLNLIGGVLSAAYGFLTGTLPTAILNVCLCLINGAYLFQYSHSYRKKKRSEALAALTEDEEEKEDDLEEDEEEQESE